MSRLQVKEPSLAPKLLPPPEEILTSTPQVFSSKRQEMKEDENEPRSMSLDSRIESLLSGCMSPEAPAACQAAPPGPSSGDTDNKQSYAGIPLDLNTSQNTYPPVSTSQEPADDEDCMILSGQQIKPKIESIQNALILYSGESGEDLGAVDVIPADSFVPLPSVIPSQMGLPIPNSSVPLYDWSQQSDVAYCSMSGYMNTYSMQHNFNPNFVNQYNNGLNNRGRSADIKRNRHFKRKLICNTVLKDLVKELKEIMAKDLCKKMVESSAFKSYESWWDKEKGRTKAKLLQERPQQQWSNTDGVNIGGMDRLGGSLHTSIPRMPSFKVSAHASADRKVICKQANCDTPKTGHNLSMELRQL